MKPDWKDAPEWAEHLAQDLCGEWWWFDNDLPKPNKNGFVWESEGDCEYAKPLKNKNWQESLEGRPTNDDENDCGCEALGSECSVCEDEQ